MFSCDGDSEDSFLVLFFGFCFLCDALRSHRSPHPLSRKYRKREFSLPEYSRSARPHLRRTRPPGPAFPHFPPAISGHRGADPRARLIGAPSHRSGHRSRSMPESSPDPGATEAECGDSRRIRVPGAREIFPLPALWPPLPPPRPARVL